MGALCQRHMEGLPRGGPAVRAEVQNRLGGWGSQHQEARLQDVQLRGDQLPQPYFLMEQRAVGTV